MLRSLKYKNEAHFSSRARASVEARRFRRARTPITHTRSKSFVARAADRGSDRSGACLRYGTRGICERSRELLPAARALPFRKIFRAFPVSKVPLSLAIAEITEANNKPTRALTSASRHAGRYSLARRGRARAVPHESANCDDGDTHTGMEYVQLVDGNISWNTRAYRIARDFEGARSRTHLCGTQASKQARTHVMRNQRAGSCADDDTYRSTSRRRLTD